MARNDNSPATIDKKAASSRLKGEDLERELFVSSDNSEYYRQIGTFLFWVATTVAAAVVGGLSLFGGAEGAFAGAAEALGLAKLGGTWTLAGILGAVSATTFVGSVQYNRAAARETERNDTLYSVRQAEDMAESLVEKLESKAKENVMLKDALNKPEPKEQKEAPASQPFERHYEINRPDMKGEVTVKADNQPNRNWVSVTGKASTRGASQQWAEYVQATQSMAVRDL
jgi:hypothetical protein